MPVKRSASVAALPPAGRRARARLCLRLAAPLSFLLLLAALLRAQPLLGVLPPAAPPPAAGPAKVAFLFLVRAGVPLDFAAIGDLFGVSRFMVAHANNLSTAAAPSGSRCATGGARALREMPSAASAAALP